MSGPLDKLEFKFVNLNHFIMTDTSEVQKCPFSENHINLQTDDHSYLMDQSFKA